MGWQRLTYIGSDKVRSDWIMLPVRGEKIVEVSFFFKTMCSFQNVLFFKKRCHSFE